MRRMLLQTVLAVAVVCSSAGADTLELKSGKSLTGKIVRESKHIVFIEIDGKVRKIYRKNIKAVSRDDTASNRDEKDVTLRDGNGVGLFLPYTTKQANAAERVVRRIVRELSREVGVELSVLEADHYLVITNIKPQYQKQCVAILNRLYTTVGKLFGIPKGAHVFVGRLPVFIFENFEQYQVAAQLLHSYPVDRRILAYHMTTRPFQPGRQHIVAYGLSNWDRFAHTLVHETAHAFIARFLSEERLPTWVEEGFAEFVAGEVLQPRRPNVPITAHQFAEMLRGAPFDYPRARQAIDLLLRGDRDKFVGFIAALKLEAASPEAALEKSFGFGFDKLTQLWQADGKNR